MDGYHKVSFKITINNQENDDAPAIGTTNNLAYMPYFKKKTGKSASSFFFYQAEMMVSQYAPPKSPGDPHFFDLQHLPSVMTEI